LFIVSETTLFQGKLFKKKKEIHFIFFPTNKYGFSGMNNFALHRTIKKYKSDYYLFINDDAWVEKDFFSVLEKILRKSSVDIIIPMIKESKSQNVNTFGIEYLRSGLAKNAFKKDVQTQLASAACLLIKTDLLHRIHREYHFYFNPLLRYYYEDVDLSIRALRLGAKIEKHVSLQARHKGSQTSKETSKFLRQQTFRNLLWVIFLDWPVSMMIKNSLSILVVQMWVVFTQGFSFYVQIIRETVQNWQKLLYYRKLSLQNNGVLKATPNFFSKYTFRTSRTNRAVRFF
jgi:GT2 family glycosyltransferase